MSSHILLWITFQLVIAFLSHNLLVVTSTTTTTITGSDPFDNQNNYYPPSSTPPTGSGRRRHSPSTRSSPPSTGGCSCPTPTTPTIPRVSPPTYVSPRPVVGTPPVYGRTPPVYGGTPPAVRTPPVYGGTSPVVRTPPTPITVPGTTPSLPPFPFDPNSPPFPWNFWRNKPTLIFGLIGWWGTLGSAFGSSTGPIPGTSSSIPGLPTLPGLPRPTDSLLLALSNTRNDGYGDLYREGVAAYLNSLADPSKFPFTTNQVRDSFVTALSSEKAAAAQARFFRLANEKKLIGHR